MRPSLWTWIGRGSRLFSRNRQPLKSVLVVECLELRDVPAVLHPDFVRTPSSGSTPFSTSGPTGLSPTQVRHAYGFDQINFSGIAGDGAGTTIAIVDAYDDPNIASDLHQFDLRFGIADPPSFSKTNQSGGSTMPAGNKGWASEIALDVEWAHAMAPKANILLVEANDASDTNLFAAVRYAANTPGVVVVSMSFGGGEFSGQTTFDSTFRTPTGHSGVSFVASSGDSGAPVSYPATSPNVLSVGGTRLNVDSAGNVISESGWSGSGGGLSSVESRPSYQQGFVTSSVRGNPDVSYDADPATGFPVYDSYNNGTAAPWSQFGGTSAGSPQWAALIAIADQGRALASLGSLDGGSQLLPKIYSLPSTDFRDVVSGSSTGSPSYTAGSGYDFVTGRGSPIANRVVADLVGSTTVTPTAASFQISSTTTTTTAGSTLSVTVTALDATGVVIPSYLGTIHFTSSDLQAVLPTDYKFVAADQGRHTFVVTLKTAGAQTIRATDTVTASLTGSWSGNVTAAAANRLAFGQQPSNVVAGVAISPTVTVRILDAYGNTVLADSTDVVTLSLGTNPVGGTLSGTFSVKASNGIASFAGISIDKAGAGYVLHAASGTLLAGDSSAFAVVAASPASVVEDFETTKSWYIAGGRSISGYRSAAAAHDGSLGFVDTNGSDWIYRTDAAVQNKAGDALSVWLNFSGSADGRAYFGFGASSAGSLSLVAAPNSNQLILQRNSGFGYSDLGAINLTYQPNHWYKLSVSWGANGVVTGTLLDSDGTTALGKVTASVGSWAGGGIAFRATGSDKYWDTLSIAAGGAAAATPASAPNANALAQAIQAWFSDVMAGGSSIAAWSAYKPRETTDWYYDAHGEAIWE